MSVRNEERHRIGRIGWLRAGVLGANESKCATCHGVDGTGSAMGTKMGAHDLTTATAQGISDTQLTDIIANSKGKMPKYGASLKPEDIKGLVAYIRTFKK